MRETITYNGKEIKLNDFGINSDIEATVLPRKEMREIGFTDNLASKWFFTRMIQFPKNKRYKDFDISFNVSINKDNTKNLRIDILDEDFCQPYDYQYMLIQNPNFEPCLIIKEQVEKWMAYLKEKGVLTGHNVGDYI